MPNKRKLTPEEEAARQQDLEALGPVEDLESIGSDRGDEEDTEGDEEDTEGVDEEDEETGVATTKSIVPQRYAGRYKTPNDSLAVFITEQCKAEDGNFSFSKFFELCRMNGIADDQVTKYQSQVEEKRYGAAGRARMTLRNMLATKVRKDGTLMGFDGQQHAIALATAKPQEQPEAAA